MGVSILAPLRTICFHSNIKSSSDLFEPGAPQRYTLSILGEFWKNVKFSKFLLGGHGHRCLKNIQHSWCPLPLCVPCCWWWLWRWRWLFMEGGDGLGGLHCMTCALFLTLILSKSPSFLGHRISAKIDSISAPKPLREFTRTLLPARCANARNHLLIGCLLISVNFC